MIPRRVALLSDDPEVAELQATAVADEDVERRQVAMERLAAMELAEHLEDSCDLPTGEPFRPSLPGVREEAAQISVTRVLERQAVEHLAVGAHQRESIEHANRARVSVEELSEIRLAQPPIDPHAGLDADDLRDNG